MGSIQEVKEALTAKAETASIDELLSRGRKQVRIIRAEHVAQMVAEAVERAVAASGLVATGELDRLVAQSRSEFTAINKERQQEHESARRLADELDRTKGQLDQAELHRAEAERRSRVAEAEAQAANRRTQTIQERVAELEATGSHSVDLTPELTQTRARLDEVERELAHHRALVVDQRPEVASAQQRADDANGKAKVAELRAGQAVRDLDAARQRVQNLEQRLETAEQKSPNFQARLDAANAAAGTLARELAELRGYAAQLEKELQHAKARVAELEQRTAGRESDNAAASAQVDVMVRVLEELATLKAKVNQPPQPTVEVRNSKPPAADVAGPAVDQLTNALQKLSQSMNDKMDSFGRKMGISSAVEAGIVQLDGLFKDLDNQKVESNLDTMEVKKQQAGGIAANLERLKRLKGS